MSHRALSSRYYPTPHTNDRKLLHHINIETTDYGDKEMVISVKPGTEEKVIEKIDKMLQLEYAFALDYEKKHWSWHTWSGGNVYVSNTWNHMMGTSDTNPSLSKVTVP